MPKFAVGDTQRPGGKSSQAGFWRAMAGTPVSSSFVSDQVQCGSADMLGKAVPASLTPVANRLGTQS